MFNLILGFNETSDDASKAGKIFTASKFCFIFGNLKLELLVWLVIPTLATEFSFPDSVSFFWVHL